MHAIAKKIWHDTRISGKYVERSPTGAKPMRVLLVEDDLTAARGIAMMLKSGGIIVDTTDTGEEALELLRHYDYDVVVLDLMLPDMEGYEVVRRMRAARQETPVLILSGLSRPAAKVKGFAVGADDFITKPFDKAELVARMQAIVRRSKGYSQPTLRVGKLQLNLDSREVLVAGAPVHLTGKEYSILELLVLRKGMVLTKEAFLNHLYGGMDEPEMKIIDVFICKLRKKLAQAGEGSLIGTVWGRGYMMRDPAAETSFAAQPFAEPKPQTNLVPAL
jgi:two-component system, cell cycle response regulator CtrA